MGYIVTSDLVSPPHWPSCPPVLVNTDDRYLSVRPSLLPWGFGLADRNKKNYSVVCIQSSDQVGWERLRLAPQTRWAGRYRRPFGKALRPIPLSQPAGVERCWGGVGGQEVICSWLARSPVTCESHRTVTNCYCGSWGSARGTCGGITGCSSGKYRLGWGGVFPPLGRKN